MGRLRSYQVNFEPKLDLICLLMELEERDSEVLMADAFSLVQTRGIKIEQHPDCTLCFLPLLKSGRRGSRGSSATHSNQVTTPGHCIS